jgi:hypothetical protein
LASTSVGTWTWPVAASALLTRRQTSRSKAASACASCASRFAFKRFAFQTLTIGEQLLLDGRTRFVSLHQVFVAALSTVSGSQQRQAGRRVAHDRQPAFPRRLENYAPARLGNFGEHLDEIRAGSGGGIDFARCVGGRLSVYRNAGGNNARRNEFAVFERLAPLNDLRHRVRIRAHLAHAR